MDNVDYSDEFDKFINNYKNNDDFSKKIDEIYINKLGKNINKYYEILDNDSNDGNTNDEDNLLKKYIFCKLQGNVMFEIFETYVFRNNNIIKNIQNYPLINTLLKINDISDKNYEIINKIYNEDLDNLRSFFNVYYSNNNFSDQSQKETFYSMYLHDTVLFFKQNIESTFGYFDNKWFLIEHGNNLLKHIMIDDDNDENFVKTMAWLYSWHYRYDYNVNQNTTLPNLKKEESYKNPSQIQTKSKETQKEEEKKSSLLKFLLPLIILVIIISAYGLMKKENKKR